MMVNPKLSQINSYFEVAIALLQTENTDTTFSLKMMDLAVSILLAVSCGEFIDMFEDNWIYKMVRVVHRVPQCLVKEAKLVLQAIDILKLINDHRLTQQIFQFLKSFKEFEETN